MNIAKELIQNETEARLKLKKILENCDATYHTDAILKCLTLNPKARPTVDELLSSLCIDKSKMVYAQRYCKTVLIGTSGSMCVLN